MSQPIPTPPQKKIALHQKRRAIRQNNQLRKMFRNHNSHIFTPVSPNCPITTSHASFLCRGFLNYGHTYTTVLVKTIDVSANYLNRISSSPPGLVTGTNIPKRRTNPSPVKEIRLSPDKRPKRSKLKLNTHDEVFTMNTQKKKRQLPWKMLQGRDCRYKTHKA
ncbi:hypothetical protein CHS0354_038123 [Potamilus streckersoni]|uniref:Uncharacterized protein n=1 Tax=Potamilus streckersoni TaxID=2493646 RepID=A0AAE0VWW1_9BIVA|nr:hypothetical protein CHS0354_038123 [Potamilus streckersoni]